MVVFVWVCVQDYWDFISMTIWLYCRGLFDFMLLLQFTHQNQQLKWWYSVGFILWFFTHFETANYRLHAHARETTTLENILRNKGGKIIVMKVQLQLQAIEVFIIATLFSFLLRCPRNVVVCLCHGTWQRKFFNLQTNHLWMGVFSDLLWFEAEKVYFDFSFLFFIILKYH